MAVEKYDNWEKIFCEITTSKTGVSKPVSSLLKYQKKLNDFTDEMKEQFAIWAFARFDICMGGYHEYFWANSPIAEIKDTSVKKRLSHNMFLAYELSEGFMTLEHITRVYKNIEGKRIVEAKKALSLIEVLKDTQYIKNMDIVKEMHKNKVYPVNAEVLDIFDGLAKIFNKEPSVFNDVVKNITEGVCDNIIHKKKNGNSRGYLESLLKCQAHVFEDAVAGYVINKVLEMNDVLTLELLNDVITVHEKTGRDLSSVIFLKNHIEKMDIKKLVIKEDNNSLTFDLTNIAVWLKTTPNQIMKNIALLMYNYSGTEEDKRRGELNAFEMYEAGKFDFKLADNMAWTLNYDFKESEKLKKEDVANIFKKATDEWIEECHIKEMVKVPEGNGEVITYDYLMRKDVESNLVKPTSVKKSLKF